MAWAQWPYMAQWAMGQTLFPSVSSKKGKGSATREYVTSTRSCKIISNRLCTTTRYHHGFFDKASCPDVVCSRPQRNYSELVYDMSGGGSYVEASLSSIGVSSEQLVHECLRDDMKSIKPVPWPPRVEELEEEEELSPFMLKLLFAL